MSESELKKQVQTKLLSLTAEIKATESRLEALQSKKEELQRVLAACEESERARTALQQLAKTAGLSRQSPHEKPINDVLATRQSGSRPLSQAERDERNYGIQSWDPS